MDKIQIYEKSATLVLIILISALRTAGIYSTCEAGSVNEGEPANVSCHFGDDVRSRQLDIYVNRFEPKTETIFSCAWFSEPEIFTAPGVTLVGDISNKLTLMINQVNKEKFGGSYKCHVAKSNEKETVPCTLNVNEKDPNSKQTTNKIYEEKAISLFPVQEKGTEFPLYPVIGTMGGVLVVVGVCGTVFVFCWRKKKQRRKS